MQARQVARGGMMTGVSIALLYIASFLSVASWAACMLIAFIPELFFLVDERRTGCLVYAATSALSLFILPDKVIAILYAGLFGLYTVLRFFFGHIHSRMLRWACKLAFGNLWVMIVLWCIRSGLIPEFPALSGKLTVIVLVAGNLILIYYDLCLSRIFPGMQRLAQKLQNNSLK